jgi:hypothetical protein
MNENNLVALCHDKYERKYNFNIDHLLLDWHRNYFLEIPSIQIPIEKLENLVLSHHSNNHEWYDLIGNRISIDDLSSFIFEESQMPSFIPLLEKLVNCIESDEIKNVVKSNIKDENFPKLHCDLFKKMAQDIFFVKTPKPLLDKYLSDTNLVFYYGYFIDPFFLIGALYATESMVPNRAKNVLNALKRFGFSDETLTFMEIPGLVDEKHSKEWLSEVIEPIYKLFPDKVKNIQDGIYYRLDTSEKYLNRLYKQARKYE